MIVPVGASTFAEPAHGLRGVPHAAQGAQAASSTPTSATSGFAHLASNEDALKILVEAIENAGSPRQGRVPRHDPPEQVLQGAPTSARRGGLSA